MNLKPVRIRERITIRANEALPGDQFRCGYRHRSVFGIVHSNRNGDMVMLDPWYEGPQIVNRKLQGTFKYSFHPASVITVWR